MDSYARTSTDYFFHDSDNDPFTTLVAHIQPSYRLTIIQQRIQHDIYTRSADDTRFFHTFF